MTTKIKTFAKKLIYFISLKNSLAPLSILILFTGCGTIFRGKSSTLVYSGTYPPNQRVYYQGELKGTAPCTFQISKERLSKGSQSITVRADGYEDLDIPLTARIRILPLLADLAMLVAPVFVDLISGDLWKVESPVWGNLKKIDESINNKKTVSPQVDQNPIDTRGKTDLTQEDRKLTEFSEITTLRDEGFLTNDEFGELKVQLLQSKYDYTNSKAKEILKLKKLTESNIISKEEMTIIKAKVLNDKYIYAPSISDELFKLKELLDKGSIDNSDLQGAKKKLF